MVSFALKHQKEKLFFMHYSEKSTPKNVTVKSYHHIFMLWSANSFVTRATSVPRFPIELISRKYYENFQGITMAKKKF